MRRLAHILPLFLLFGCTGVMRDYGKRLVVSKVAEELDLDRDQRAATRAAVDRLADQAPELLGPGLEELALVADQAIVGGFSEEDLLLAEALFQALADEVMAAVIEEAAPILASLRGEQIDHFEARMAEHMQASRDALEKPVQERLAAQRDGIIDEIEKWMGSLDETQEAALRRHLAGLPDEAAADLAANEVRLQDFIDLLRRGPEEEAIRAALWMAWTSREDQGSAARPVAARRQEVRETLRFIDGLQRPEQREAMRDRLRSLHDKVKAFLGPRDG